MHSGTCVCVCVHSCACARARARACVRACVRVDLKGVSPADLIISIQAVMHGAGWAGWAGWTGWGWRVGGEGKLYTPS